MTRKDYISCLEKIIEYTLDNPLDMWLGTYVKKTLKDSGIIEDYKKKNDPAKAKLSKSDIEVVTAFENGWIFYTVDRAIWYNENNTQTSGPFALVRHPACKVVSARQFNKLVRLGLISSKLA